MELGQDSDVLNDGPSEAIKTGSTLGAHWGPSFGRRWESSRSDTEGVFPVLFSKDSAAVCFQEAGGFGTDYFGTVFLPFAPSQIHWNCFAVFHSMLTRRVRVALGVAALDP